MDSGTVSLIATIGIPLLIGIITLAISRKSDTEATDVKKFEVLLTSQNDRIESLEREVTDLRQRDSDREKQINRIRKVVQDWFRLLREEWNAESPMPVPEPEDMELLGLTIPTEAYRRQRMQQGNPLVD